MLVAPTAWLAKVRLVGEGFATALVLAPGAREAHPPETVGGIV